jgi:hypothetical protein
VDQTELLRHLVETMDALGIAYMIAGSQASIYYGEPRFTRAIDVVANIDVSHVPGLLASFPVDEFYISEEAVREAIRTGGQFKIIHPAAGLKIDVMVKKDSPYDRVQFERRQRKTIAPNLDAHLARPEDIILYKILYFSEGGSERHLRDILGMLRIPGAEIDRAYVTEWAAHLGLGTIWESVQEQAPRSDGA